MGDFISKFCIFGRKLTDYKIPQQAKKNWREGGGWNHATMPLIKILLITLQQFTFFTAVIVLTCAISTVQDLIGVCPSSSLSFSFIFPTFSFFLSNLVTEQNCNERQGYVCFRCCAYVLLSCCCLSTVKSYLTGWWHELSGS